MREWRMTSENSEDKNNASENDDDADDRRQTRPHDQ